MLSGEDNRKVTFNWLATFLKDHGFQFSKCGFKRLTEMGNHELDATTGYWKDPQYSGSKPPRFLFQIDLTKTPISASLPNDLEFIGVGFVHAAGADKAALALRILPMMKVAGGSFQRADEFEANLLFVLHGAFENGGAADPVTFNPKSGALVHHTNKEHKGKPYILAALLGLKPREAEFNAGTDDTPKLVTYGDMIDALVAAILVHPEGATATQIPVYDLCAEGESERLKSDIKVAWDKAGPAPIAAQNISNANKKDTDDEAVEQFDLADLDVPENPDLIGIEPSVYRQINAALKSGKQHIMFYGPPGTGKTTIARWVAASLPGGDYDLLTGSADWSSQDVIGGYQPVGDGEVDFIPGILLRRFNCPFIFDEMNRCDIDKVIGPLFTVLSGQQTTLPYRLDIKNKNSPQYTILPYPKANAEEHEFAPGIAWRLLATINSIDKASLYQMSFALSRRFGWVFIDVPRDLRGFLVEYLRRKDPAFVEPEVGDQCPLQLVWEAINKVRVFGPAPFIDTINAIRVLAPKAPFFGVVAPEMKEAAIDAINLAVLPMLDGIRLGDATSIGEALIAAFQLEGSQADGIRVRMKEVAI
ncbi:MAG: AAA family ATPase [Proteobacteria bacterium]|nr:AAA family ATPase [Pseudomonadota bacterium]